MTELVYSTETGRIKPQTTSSTSLKKDSIVRIMRQTNGRKGNGVSIITGLELDETSLKKIAKELKQFLSRFDKLDLCNFD